jgi:fumarate hydratase class II
VTNAPLWGEQTDKVRGLVVAGEPMPAAVLTAIAEIKVVAARRNAAAGVLPTDVADAIAAAAEEVAAGEHADQFPIDVLQTGSGTASNMNVNEVVATLASRRLGNPVHPNDDVNASQSSNDVVPTAVHVAALRAALRLTTALAHLSGTLSARATDFADTVTVGRTHLMDAVPITVGAEFSGWAAQAGLAAERIVSVLPRVAEVPLGGTAVGTGLNTPSGWRLAVVAALADRTGLALVPARDGVEAQGARDSLVELSGAVRTAAVSLSKIADDLRLKGPALAAGSSIMPGKVNPVIPEIVLQAAAQVIGHDATVAWAGARGQLELNAMVPVIARNLLAAIEVLTNAAGLLADRCVAGIEVDAGHTRSLAESSPAVVTALNAALGYAEAAAVVTESQSTGVPIAEVVTRRGHVGTLISADELRAALDVDRMARGF